MGFGESAEARGSQCGSSGILEAGCGGKPARMLVWLDSAAVGQLKCRVVIYIRQSDTKLATQLKLPA